MRTSSLVIFSIFLISSIILVSSIDSSHADEIMAKSIGFDGSIIFELKNSRGSITSIDSVRVWINEENEFTSFKTEQGWMGKKQLNGVIEFTSQNQVNPGESVKFGIKTLEENPVINWKALDSSGNVISSASTKISDNVMSENELNQPKIIGVKDESIFRFIPKTPNADSIVRVVGEKFVPNQELDFYIGDNLSDTIQTDVDGKILFTTKIPEVADKERTEFILRDSGGNEKIVSIRINDLENRKIADEIKLSFGNTPQQVKRGETITLEGMATPNTTLTITGKYPDGGIVNIDTIQVSFDGKWTYDNLFSPDLELGMISIEINDGKTKSLRNIEVVSAKVINVKSINTMYESGETVTFEGIALPNEDISVVIEDSVGTEIFSRSVTVSDTGKVTFNIEIPRGSIEGTYVAHMFQGNEEGIAIFGIGQEPMEILVVRPIKLNFNSEETIEISIQGPTNAQVGIIVIDSADREKLSDTLNLGPSGKTVYEIDSGELATGAYTFDVRRGESTGKGIFTIGLTTGSGAISIQTTRDEYKQGEQVLILGNTGAINVLLDISITDSSGTVIKRIDSFSDKFGVFKVDNFRIPIDGKIGNWNVSAKSGGNFNNAVFKVIGEEEGLTVKLNNSEYNIGEMIEIKGDGARMSATITMKIYDSNDEVVDTLNITAKSDGGFSTIWMIPSELELGEYEIRIDDGAGNASVKFNIK
tara:strand:+ start:860 stop:2974 length:2115 start_codon:yes stop_codon:yes gene_type:complete